MSEPLVHVAENLAALHAWCLTHDGWAKKFPPMPKAIVETMAGSWKPMLEKTKETFCPQHLDPKLVDIMMKECTTVDDVWYVTVLHEEMKMPPVLVHGDLWVGNMMFKKKVGKDGAVEPSDELLAIFDWQTCIAGCASLDFIRLACTSMSPELRRNKLPGILQHYHNTLKQKLGKEPPFTYETLMKSYTRALKAGFLLGFGMLTLLAGQPEIIGGEEYKDAVILRAKCLLEDTVKSLNVK